MKAQNIPEQLPGAIGVTGAPRNPTTPKQDTTGPAIVGMPGAGFHIIAPLQIAYADTAAGKAALSRICKIAAAYK